VEVERVVGWIQNVPCGEAYRINDRSSPSDSGCLETKDPAYPHWECNVVDND